MDARRCLCVLLLLPLLGALVGRILPAASCEPLAGPSRSSLAFDQYLVNLRQAPVRPTMSGDFRFTNTGSAPLTIVALEPSCGCLKPQLAGNKKTYAPGERGLFRVDVATVNESPGDHSYTIKVRYTDPQPQELVVRFKLSLPERKVTINPPELAFFQYNGQPAARDIYITDYRGSTLQVTSATSSLELVGVDIQPADLDESGNHRVPIRLSVPGRVPPGRQMATITIRTSDPEFSVVRIPVLIDGPSQPEGDIQLIGHDSPTGPSAVSPEKK